MVTSIVTYEMNRSLKYYKNITFDKKHSKETQLIKRSYVLPQLLHVVLNKLVQEKHVAKE